MKKQMMYALRQYGDGLKHLESQTITSGTKLLEVFEACDTKPFDPYHHIRTCIATIIMNLAYGKSSGNDVREIVTANENLEHLMKPAGAFFFLDIFPVLRFILPSVRKAYWEVVKAAKHLHKISNKLTQGRQKVLDVDNPQPKFYIDHFLSLKDKPIMDRKSQTDIVIEDENIHLMGTDLFLGGITTTTHTLYMLLGILVNHPDIQDRAYADITSVLAGRTPTIEDKSRLPFIEALILETIRYSTVFPLLVPHYTKKGGQINGYLIPENTAIMVNVWALHHDKRYWDEPWVFNPWRFLQNDRSLPVDDRKKQCMLGFGSGRRACPGEHFAKNRLFILVTMLLQKYKFLAADGFPKPQHDPRKYDPNIILNIKPYYLCVQARP